MTTACPAKTYPYPPIDPTKNQVITIIGKKGSGKSVAARHLFRSWPGVDRVVVDVTGDADPGADMAPIMLPRDATKLPTYDPNKGPQVYRLIPDTKSPTFHDDLDRAISLGLYPKDRPVLIWIDENGEVLRRQGGTPRPNWAPPGTALQTVAPAVQPSRHGHRPTLSCAE